MVAVNVTIKEVVHITDKKRVRLQEKQSLVQPLGEGKRCRAPGARAAAENGAAALLVACQDS